MLTIALIGRLLAYSGLQRSNARKESSQDYDLLWQAIRRLRREDHNLNVLVKQARVRPRGDLLRLWRTGVVGFLAPVMLSINYGIEPGRLLLLTCPTSSPKISA